MLAFAQVIHEAHKFAWEWNIIDLWGGDDQLIAMGFECEGSIWILRVLYHHVEVRTYFWR